MLGISHHATNLGGRSAVYTVPGHRRHTQAHHPV
jgi:hypothetical protein